MSSGTACLCLSRCRRAGGHPRTQGPLERYPVSRQRSGGTGEAPRHGLGISARTERAGHRRFTGSAQTAHPIDLAGTDVAVKAENDLLAMLYRRQVEFAVGHGVGVHVDVSPDPNQAVRVRTKVVPSYEVPERLHPGRKTPKINPAFAKLEGLVLDMKLLAEANPKQYRPKLKPTARSLPGLDRPGGEDGSPIPPRDWRHFKHVAQQALLVAARRSSGSRPGWTCSTRTSRRPRRSSS